jgi:hypothetical protein
MKTFLELDSYEDIEVDDSGYDRYQSVFGWMDISFEGVFEELRINVEEVTAGMGMPEVYMTLTFDEDDEDKDKVIEFFGSAIQYDEDREHWLIVDEGLVIDLYEQYGENA